MLIFGISRSKTPGRSSFDLFVMGGKRESRRSRRQRTLVLPSSKERKNSTIMLHENPVWLAEFAARSFAAVSIRELPCLLHDHHT